MSREIRGNDDDWCCKSVVNELRYVLRNCFRHQHRVVRTNLHRCMLLLYSFVRLPRSTRSTQYYIILLSQIHEAFLDNKLPSSSYNKPIYEMRPPKREQRVS